MSRAVIAVTLITLSLIKSADSQRGAEWVSEVAFSPGTQLRGCAIGDLLAEHPGNEIVAVGADGSVHVAYRKRGKWTGKLIHRATGALVQVAIGDILPDRAGLEVIVAGMLNGRKRGDSPGAVILLYRTASEWKAETLYTSRTILNGVCLFENSVFVTGGNAAVHRLCRVKNVWHAEHIVDLSSAGKSVNPVEGGIIIACMDGTLVHVVKSDRGWDARTVDSHPATQVCLDTDGRRVVTADEDGAVSILYRDTARAAAPWQREVLFHDTDRVCGGVLADLVPQRSGLEIAITGNSKRVTLLRRGGRNWRKRTLYEDTASLQHITAGDLDGRSGSELVTCGNSGRLILLRRDVPAVPGPQAGDWQAEAALDIGIGIGGCAVGDLMAERPGDEIAAVSQDGAVHLVHRKDRVWVARTVHRARGELIQVTIGDVDPRTPGNEIIGVGVAEGRERSGGLGAVVVVHRSPEGWHGEQVFTSKALVHGACVFGGACFVTGYDLAVHRIRFSGGKWVADKVADLNGAGKQALATPQGVVIACRDGALLRLERAKDGFSLATLDRRTRGRSRLGTDGSRIIVSDDDGTLSIITPTEEANVWKREEIHREFDLLRGAVLADLDPDTPGLEAATAGYERKITLLRRFGGSWWSRMLYCDRDRLHHLAAGNVDGCPGLDLVACGYSGRLLVLRRSRPTN